MIVDQTMCDFLEELASNAPTPGGGSAGAMVGAVGAALVAMMGNLTVGKKGYEAVEEEMRRLVEEAGRLRGECARLADEDVRVFEALMAAYRRPRGDEDERVRRAVAIQAALRDAIEAPLALARVCMEVMELAEAAAERGNANVLSDAVAGAIAAHAALRFAALNVWMNVPSLEDREFAERSLAELEPLLNESSARADALFERVRVRPEEGSDD